MSDPLIFPQIDPNIISFGHIAGVEIAIRWYGTMYLVGLICAFALANREVRLGRSPYSEKQVGDLLFNCFLGAVLGGRIGYVLFYQTERFFSDPLYILQIMDGGMSFHGGLLGVLTVFLFFAKSTKTTFFQVGDFIAPLVPLGLGFGRIGNFINGELWGRTTDVPWGMIFPGAGALPRHPSQLYQFFLEGLVLFTIVYWFSRKPRPIGAVSGVFLIGYGCFRFIVEFFRQPDEHLGLLTLGMSMGQWLSLPMIAIGIAIVVFAFKSKATQTQQA